MLTHERQQHIIDFLTKKKSATVAKLAKKLFVSQATIRRDLSDMEKQGLLKRSHGGAVLLESNNAESSLLVREQENIKEKKAIAELAVDFIRDNYTVFMDSSSTVSNIIPLLKKFSSLTVITTGLKNAMLLSQGTDAKIYLAGGMVNSNSNSIVGSDTTVFLSRFNADICFVSCSGIDQDGQITDVSIEQSNIKNIMVNGSDIKVLLCDSGKFNAKYLCKSFTISDFDYILTDKPVSSAFLSLAKNSKCEFVFSDKN